MDTHTRHQQKQRSKIYRTLQELMTVIMEAQLTKQAQGNNENFDAFQDVLTDSLNEPMLSKSVSIAPFLLPTAPPPAPANNLIITAHTTVQTDINICSDLRGSSRACCNSATQCFGNFKTIIGELDNARSDSFALNSACRQLAYQLKRDQLCFKQSLSRCSGPDKAILDRRFDVRFAYMTGQFYKHCEQDTEANIFTAWNRFNEQTTTQENLAPSGMITKESMLTKSDSVFTTLSHNQNNTGHGSDIVIGHGVVSSATSTAILAGVISGGIVLLLVLAVAIALWCRNKHNKNAGNNSSDSLGIFFHKRPNICFRDQVGGDNNKLSVCKQDSNIYAEIDENKVNVSSDRPPVPGTLPKLSPMSDEKSLLYTTPVINGPFITSCGQLCYDSIQATNTVSNCAEALFYSSTLIIGNSDAVTYCDQQDISSRNSPSQPQTGHDESVHAIVATSNILDDYEQPVNNSNMSLCCTLPDNEPPPNHFAPVIPNSLNTHNSKKGKCAVKVLPTNSFVPFSLRPVLASRYPHTPAFNSRQITTTDSNIWLKNRNTPPR